MNNQNDMNNSNNQVSVDNNQVNISNQQTTNLPVTEVKTSPTGIKFNNNEDNNNQKDGCFKYLFAFIFLVGMIVLVLFLPQVSKLIESKTTKTSDTTQKEITSGTLLCTMDKVSDNIDYDYEIKMIFKNKKLISAKYTTVIESYDNPAMIEKKQNCDKASEISQNINGLDMECRLNDTVFTSIENFDLKNLNTNELSSYTQASGTKLEYKYGDNVYDIKTKLTKKGYDCDISSIIQEE